MTFKKVPVLQAGCNESVHSRDVLSVNLPHKGREEKKGLKVFSLAGKREAVLVRLFELEK